ncbi:MAG: hypothetical protein JSR36_13255 [Proteobacteria bacterium]|nr:hypothetical protein [Pseudomonadota bacterium]
MRHTGQDARGEPSPGCIGILPNHAGAPTAPTPAAVRASLGHFLARFMACFLAESAVLGLPWFMVRVLGAPEHRRAGAAALPQGAVAR